MVDLVYSRNSKYLRIKLNFFWPSQSLDQSRNGRGEKKIPFGSTLYFNDLERSSSFSSWMVSFSNLWIRKRIACCFNWGWVLYLSVYLGSLGTLVFWCWGDSSSGTHMTLRPWCMKEQGLALPANWMLWSHNHGLPSMMLLIFFRRTSQRTLSSYVLTHGGTLNWSRTYSDVVDKTKLYGHWMHTI